MTAIASSDERTGDRLEAIRRETAELVRATPVLTSRSLRWSTPPAPTTSPARVYVPDDAPLGKVASVRGLAALLSAIAAQNANLIQIEHVRDGIDLAVRETGVELTLETQGAAHARTLVDRLGDDGYAVRVVSGTSSGS